MMLAVAGGDAESGDVAAAGAFFADSAPLAQEIGEFSTPDGTESPVVVAAQPVAIVGSVGVIEFS